MAGSLIRVLPKTDFVVTPVGTTLIEVPLAEFDATAFPTLNLIARVHAKSASSGSTQTLNVLLRNLAPYPQDPAADFAGTTIATATFTMNGGTTGAQTPQIVACSTPISYRVRLLISYSQTTAATAFAFSLSADALGRE